MMQEQQEDGEDDQAPEQQEDGLQDEPGQTSAADE